MQQRVHVIHPVASDVMRLAENLCVSPDVVINGNGIAGFGLPGSGKTGILARILEQASQFHVPIVCFDKEGDLTSAVGCFPRGVLGTFQNCPSGTDVLKYGLQVVYDLPSWPSLEAAGQTIAHIVRQLLREGEALPYAERVPLLIALDEAEYWLPQKRGEALSEETYATLYDAFHELATIGRKRGPTPALFTQQIAMLHKDVLAPGLFIFGRQTLDTCLKRYMEYLVPMGDLTEKQFKQRITRLSPGKAIVKLPGGGQKVVQFYKRESVHVSHTPSVQAAMNKYAHLPMPPASFGYDLPRMVAKPPGKMPDVSGMESATERCFALLNHDPTLRTVELCKLAHCSHSQSSRARTKFFRMK